jgi:HTH-type transcriptional regulator/antitoxin HigA
MEMKIDPKRYGRLLAKVLPRPIESDEECDRITAVIESLMGKDLAPEQEALLQLLVGLVTAYEDRTVQFPSRGTPHEMLQYALEQSGMKQSELAELWGTSRGYTSDIVSGKRPIGIEQAKKLAERFKVSVEVFV